MVLHLILRDLVKFVKDPINQFVVMPMRRRISYAFNCNSRVKTLQDEVDQLKAKRSLLQQSVDEERRNARDINPNVTDWLSDSERAIGQAEELVRRKEEAEKKCFVGLCPNFKTRYQLSKNAELKATELQKLLNKEGLDIIPFRSHLQLIPKPGTGEPLSSRVSMLNQIMDALRDDDLNMIGVWGMGGIGKTTLAKMVADKALQEMLFEIVIMVVVSQTPELRRIQEEIAEHLGLKFDAEEISGRASQLHRRLENSKVLIILDDVWKKLDLDHVGIPSREASKFCKIMVTSRNRDLLYGEMGVQKIFALEALQEQEALSLFLSVAEPTDDLLTIAAEIVEKCAGLPLLIQIVARELRNREIHQWHHTLHKLSASRDDPIQDRVYKVIESSYDMLPGEEIKSFFLLCALFGQSNIQIQYLLIYSMGLGLLEDIQIIEDARDRVLTLIEKLKANSFLLDGDTVGFVKMNNVFREAALKIASREHHAFIGTGEVRLKDWPNKDCTRISLPFCKVTELPVGLNYPMAELFFLFSEDLSLEIPNSFFSGIPKLKVVDFTGMRLLHLPSSIGLLKNLQTLCLHRCRLDNVGTLGELKQLEFLSFANSNIIELPREIEHLTRLKLLDLRSCSYLLVIPASILSNLFSLEELYILNSFVRWDARGNVSLVELENLPRMSTLQIQIPNLKLIPVGFKCFNQLRHYKISIGNIWDWNEQYERSRTLKLKGEAGVHLEDGTKLLLRETEDLYLDGVAGIQSIFYEGFPMLKHMHVENDFGIQHLMKSTIPGSYDAFPFLESLYLNKLHSMEKICSGKLGTESFRALQILKISNCDKLTCLFSLSSGKYLGQLQELEVESCENMVAVVGEGIEEIPNNEMMEFTHLSSLKLKNLPHLLGLCRLKEVSFPNLSSLEVNQCESLKHIFMASMESMVGEEIEDVHRNIEVIEFAQLTSLKLKNLPHLIGVCKLKEEIEQMGMLFGTMVSFPKLSSLEVNGCKSLKHIFMDSKESVVSQGIEDEVIEFTHLSSLKLKNLPLLIGFCKSKEDSEQTGLLFSSKVSFRNLTSLEVDGCKSLKHIFTASVGDVHHNNEETEFTQLTSLKLKNLPHLIGLFKSKEESEQEGLLFSTMVSFPDLTSLEVKGCNSLKHIFAASTVKCLMQLKNLKIIDCELDEEIIKSKEKEETEEEEDNRELIVFPKLDSLSLLNLKNVKRFSNRYSFKFPLLTQLTIEGCHVTRNSVGKVSCREIEGEGYLLNEMVNFSSLETMDVDRGLRDVELLEHLEPHRNLKRINIKYYRGEKLPSWMLRMKSPSDSLVILNNLVDLKLEWCYNCEQLPCLGILPHLKFLEMNHMGKVKCIDNEFYGIDNEGSSDGCLRFFPQLQSLSVAWMANLTEWSYPSDGKAADVFPRLQNLSIQYCPKLTGFPMNGISELVRLEIKDSEELNLEISEQQRFAFLTGLSITGCPKLSDLQNWLKNILSFKELSVRKCQWLTFIPHDLKKVSYLTSLEIYCCRRLRYFPEDILSKLRVLQHLSVGAFSVELDDFHYLNGIKDLQCLEELEIWGSDFFGREMRSLPNQLQHLSVVKSLKIMGFTAMEALPEWLTNLQTLRSLSLDHCRKLGSEPTATIVQRLPNLLRLSASSCPILQGSEFEWLQPLQSRKIEVEVSHVSKVRIRLGC